MAEKLILELVFQPLPIWRLPHLEFQEKYDFGPNDHGMAVSIRIPDMTHHLEFTRR